MDYLVTFVCLIVCIYVCVTAEGGESSGGGEESRVELPEHRVGGQAVAGAGQGAAGEKGDGKPAIILADMCSGCGVHRQ